jgi:hypothetical protein
VGKVRLALAPAENHWWHVPLYVTARGLTTSPIPADDRLFEIAFDFLADALVVTVNDGRQDRLPLRPQTVGEFYRSVMQALHGLGIAVDIWPVPVEVVDPVPFEDDRRSAYDGEQARRFWRVLGLVERELQRFRWGFLGKRSPVHFFWGSFDLAHTRFSGRRAPEHPGVPSVPDFITREAYSHELWSAGFWPGDARFPAPVFYAYAYPTPPGFAVDPVRPSAARFEPALGEFVLPYEEMRATPSPELALEAFLTSTYETAATRGGWDRAALERAPGSPGPKPGRG